MIRKLVLLPGMDGTGDLFKNFLQALPGEFETTTVRFPSDVFLSYSELTKLVQSAIPPAEPFVLVAESFSTPLAIRFAGMGQPNLEGLVLCAGFATSPVHGWLRHLCSFLAPLLFRLTLPGFAIRQLLVGPGASREFLGGFPTVVSSVRPEVLASRFRAVLACDERANLNRIAVPILYLQAKQDRLIPASCLDQILQIKPNIAAIVLAGPHLLFQSEPQSTSQVVSEFVGHLG